MYMVMRMKVLGACLLWLCALPAGAENPAGKREGGFFSKTSWYLSWDAFGDLDRVAWKIAPASTGEDLPRVLTSSQVSDATAAGFGLTVCPNDRFSLDLRLHRGSAGVSFDYTYDGGIPFFRYDLMEADRTVSGETALDLFGAGLTARYDMARNRWLGLWSSFGVRGFVISPREDTLSLPETQGFPETEVTLDDAEEVDVEVGLGLDVKVTDRFDLSLSGDHTPDLGWRAGVSLVYKASPGGCGRCKDDSADEDESEEEEPCGPFLPGEVPLPVIETPPVTRRLPARVDVGALPAGATAHLPAFDADRFIVRLPDNRVSSRREMLREVVGPITRALGFEPRLRRPASTGIAVEGGDLAVLARHAVLDYEQNAEAPDPGERAVLDALLGAGGPDPDASAVLEGTLGMSLASYVADVTRGETHFPFQQVVGDTPIEHTLLLATYRSGHGVTSVRGTLIENYVVDNEVSVSSPVAAAEKALSGLPGIQRVELPAAGEGPVLVLLPYGNTPRGEIRLRHAYRMILTARFCQQVVPFLVWIDAESGDILKLENLVSEARSKKKRKAVDAEASVYNRDPGMGTTKTVLRVDPASDGRYSLEVEDELNRVDFQEDGFDDFDLAIPVDSEGSSDSMANFDQWPINDTDEALCGEGTNKQFQQVHFFAALTRYRRYSLALGVDPVFSLTWNPGVESPRAGCNAYSNMSFGACPGYYNAACPDFWDGTESLENCMNFAHDNTVIAHEMGHNITYELTNRRPFDWCGKKKCALPVGWKAFHELADFWSDHLESTNCVAGWTCKNVGGVDHSRDCRAHSEGKGLPRLHEVTVPFDPSSPGDHFPEHRRLASDDYGDMQIATAALWQLQLGMRSKNRSAGLIQIAPRLARALRRTGFLSFKPEPTDLGAYQLLYDLAVELMDEWAQDGDHLAQEVAASFARTGIFLIPYQCLDGDVSTVDPRSRPSGESGADAVIDVDDNDPGDDPSIRGVRHPETDFLRIGGPAPTFHVWTGPLYRFGADGEALLDSMAPCNDRYFVELSPDPSFPKSVTVDSGWLEAPTHPGCYDSWAPSDEVWERLQAEGAGSRIYYRVTTVGETGGDERISTRPGHGLWTVSPPFIVLTGAE